MWFLSFCRLCVFDLYSYFLFFFFIFFFKQKTAYEMRISDWSSDVCSSDLVRAEDDSGAFGVLHGHADFVTALTVSVISWRDRDRAEHNVAVRGGVLQVRAGERVEIATPEAVAGDDMPRLETEVLDCSRDPLQESI